MSTSKNRVFTVNDDRNIESGSQGRGRQEGVRRSRSRHLQHSLVRQLFSSLLRRFLSPDPGHRGRGGEEAKGLRDSCLSYRGLPECGVGIDGLPGPGGACVFQKCPGILRPGKTLEGRQTFGREKTGRKHGNNIQEARQEGKTKALNTSSQKMKPQMITDQHRSVSICGFLAFGRVELGTPFRYNLRFCCPPETERVPETCLCTYESSGSAKPGTGVWSPYAQIT